MSTAPLITLGGSGEQQHSERKLFLSREWISEVVAAVQREREDDTYFRRVLSPFHLRVLYEIHSLPAELQGRYHGSDRMYVSAQVDSGVAKEIHVGAHIPHGKPDLQVTCEYSVARRLVIGELSPGASFFNRLLEVKFHTKSARRPNFLAKSVTAAHRVLKLARGIPTRFPAQK